MPSIATWPTRAPGEMLELPQGFFLVHVYIYCMFENICVYIMHIKLSFSMEGHIDYNIM